MLENEETYISEILKDLVIKTNNLNIYELNKTQITKNCISNINKNNNDTRWKNIEKLFNINNIPIDFKWLSRLEILLKSKGYNLYKYYGYIPSIKQAINILILDDTSSNVYVKIDQDTDIHAKEIPEIYKKTFGTTDGIYINSIQAKFIKRLLNRLGANCISKKELFAIKIE